MTYSILVSGNSKVTREWRSLPPVLFALANSQGPNILYMPVHPGLQSSLSHSLSV